MERIIEEKLLKWKRKTNRKPLILKGARQVGKTYSLLEFGKKHFKNFHYFNFEESQELNDIFEFDLNPERILKELSLFKEEKIDIEKDLIIFDEIQFSPKALTSLKYFFENFPNSYIISAGSLLGIKMKENISSFPVGKVEFLDMYPMNFYEFISETESKEISEIYDSFKLDDKLSEFIHKKLWNALKDYFVIGGLPEIVLFFSRNKNYDYETFETIRELQRNILLGYESDIAKYSGRINSMNIIRVLKNIPSQLSKEINGSLRRYKFKGVIPGKKGYASLSSIIDWLINSGLVLKEHIVKNAQYPLEAQVKENMFKLYLFDIGLLGFLSGLEPDVIIKMNFGNYKGYFAENFVMQELVSYGFENLYAWHGRESEIEFLLQYKGEIIPLEVKSGDNLRAKSFTIYKRKYKPKIAIKLSSKKPAIHKDGTINLPLYFAGKIKDIIEQIL